MCIYQKFWIQAWRKVQGHAWSFFSRFLFDLHINALTFDYVACLFLVDNPLNCSCGFAEFFNHADDISGIVIGKCYAPSNTSFQMLKSLNKDEIREIFCDECQLRNACLNGALCLVVNQTEIACKCSANFTGKKCEKYLYDNNNKENENENSDDNHISVVVVAVCAALFQAVVVTTTVLCFVMRRRRSEEDQIDFPSETTFLL